MQAGKKKSRVGLLATHPIQYYVPWYRALAEVIDLKVFFAHKQDASGQAQAGYGVEFDWDIPLFEGYDFDFLTNISKTPSLSSFSGCDTPSIYGIIDKEKFDAFIVQGWFVKSYCQAIWSCWRTRTPILVRGDSQLQTPRGFIKNCAKYPAFRLLIPRFDGYLVVGKRSEEYYRHYGADSQRFFSSPHCVDNSFFREKAEIFRARRDQIRRDWKIPTDAVVFMLVGRLISMKRPMDFLQAVKSAATRSPKIHALIVGDGELRPKIEQIIREENLPVTLTGFLNQSEIPKAYAVSDILVLPSGGEETWGLVVNEAMASGLPAIVSDKAGCGPDLIRTGETGDTYPCGSVEALSDLMISWLTDSAAIAYRGTQAQEWIKRYSIETATEGTLRAIQSVVRSSTPSLYNSSTITGASRAE